MAKTKLSLQLLSDLELIPLLEKGVAESYTELYSRYAEFVYSVAMKMLKDEDESHDLVQDVFTKIWEQGSLSINTEIRFYLYRVTRNKILNQFHREKYKVKYLDSLQGFINTGIYCTDEKIRANEMTALIEREIDNLPKKMKKVFELSRKENKSYKEIAGELRISEETVRKQIHNALKILRTKLNFLFITFYL